MKKLKVKVFIIIFSIFSLVILGVCFITNARNYYMQKREIESILNRPTIDDKQMMDFKDKEFHDKKLNESFKLDFENPPRIFLDYTVYTIILDSDGNYLDIVNHSLDDVDENYVRSISENIIDNKKHDFYVGNLFFNKYSYSFKNGTLIIVDNSVLNKKLCLSLVFTILLVCILEIIVFVITWLLTRWVIKPVELSFLRQKRFIEDASHELKTPLTIMMASIDAFERDKDEKWLSNVKTEVTRMTSLVIDLLDLSRLENENNIDFKEEDLSNIIESSILTFESLFYESNLKLEYNIQKEIKLDCNKNQIKQLITILMDNAIKHSEETGKVIIDLRRENKNIILEVKNKGTIKKGEEEKIFERFYKSDESRNRDSNNYGLGLAIAKSIVLNHRGEISVSSKKGYTTFKVKWD